MTKGISDSGRYASADQADCWKQQAQETQVAILDDSVKTENGTILTDEALPVIAAFEQAIEYSADPLQKAFPLRGTILIGRINPIGLGIMPP